MNKKSKKNKAELFHNPEDSVFKTDSELVKGRVAVRINSRTTIFVKPENNNKEYIEAYVLKLKQNANQWS